MADGIAPQIVTGAFTIGGVALTLAITALQRWRSNLREDRVRFHSERVSAAVDLASSAERYRRAILALHALTSAGADKQAPALVRWSEEQQHSFEEYHRAASKFALLFPADVRSCVPELSNALDQLRNVRPNADIDASNTAARAAADRLLTACRVAVGIVEKR